MPEHLDEGVENRDSLSDDLESVRLQDLDSTLRGAPGRLDEPIKLEFDLLGELLHNLVRAITIAIFPATAAFLATFGLWVGAVLPGIRQAQSDTYNAEANYHLALRQTDQLLGELATLGAPSADLEVIYFAFADATGDDARKAAEIYLGVLSDQITIARGSDVERTRHAEELVAPTNEVRAAVADAYHVWTGRLDTTPGRIAVTLRMVDAPPEVMGLYERSHPRAD